MKYGLLLSAMLTFIFVACGSDEEEMDQNCETLSEVLIGVWDSNDFSGTTVEFLESNEVIDDAFLFVDEDFGGVLLEEKVYSVDGNDKIDFAYSKGFNISSRTGTVQGFSCDTLRIAVNSQLLRFTKQ